MSLFTLNEYTEKKNFRPQKTIVTYKDYDDMKNNVRKMKEELRKQPTWDEIMERIEKLTCPEDKER